MKPLFILLLLCTVANAQWIEEPQQQWLEDLAVQKEQVDGLIVEASSVLLSADEATRAALDAANEAREAAREAAEAAEKSLKAAAVTTSKGLAGMTAVDAAIAELRARPYFTEEQIRAFAREEAKKLVATVKMPDGTTQDVPARNVDVVVERQTVVGYSGTFEVPQGGYITAIDGQPVSRMSASVGTTTNYQIQASRRSGRVVEFLARPLRGTCRIVNGKQVCN